MTTADLKQKYDVVGVSAQEQGTFPKGFKGDPIEDAVKECRERSIEGVKAMAANGVVDFRVECEGPAEESEPC